MAAPTIKPISSPFIVFQFKCILYWLILPQIISNSAYKGQLTFFCALLLDSNINHGIDRGSLQPSCLLLNKSNRRGRLTPDLSHHRTCGSAYGCSKRLTKLQITYCNRPHSGQQLHVSPLVIDRVLGNFPRLIHLLWPFINDAVPVSVHLLPRLPKGRRGGARVLFTRPAPARIPGE